MEDIRYTAEEIEDALYSGLDKNHEFVLASDYDALTAERDELQRRLDAAVASLKPGPEPDRQLTNIPNHTDSDIIWSEWHRQASLHARAIAIAEGE